MNEDDIRLQLIPLSLSWKAKQWFYANRTKINTWEKYSAAFLEKFFLLGKTNTLRGRISSSSSTRISTQGMGKASEVHPDMSSPWDVRLAYSAEFLQRVDSDNLWTYRCRYWRSFLLTPIDNVKALIEKMFTNQGWSDDQLQPHQRVKYNDRYHVALQIIIYIEVAENMKW
jgi:hypothetical protein